jgi:indole-3-glycerol phosphate synthase
MAINKLNGILGEIIENKEHEVQQRKEQCSLEYLQQELQTVSPVRDFRGNLRRGDGPVRLLAEIKAASPSAGKIRADFDPAEIALLYEECGAAAISVLTDEKYFSGVDKHLQAARAAVSLPVLRKDFTIDEYQLYESRALGADAILLMAQVLTQDTFGHLYEKAYDLGLQVLSEGHTEEQVRFIVSMGAKVIGVNNRNFETMKTDTKTTLDRRSLIPSDRVLVSQSGMFSREDVIPLEDTGVDAIQVGTSLMQNADIKKQFYNLLYSD